MLFQRDRSKKFRKRLKKLMDRCKLTAYGLGKLSHVDIYRILKGEGRPSRQSVLAIAAALFEYSTVITERDVQVLINSSGYPPPRRYAP